MLTTPSFTFDKVNLQADCGSKYLEISSGWMSVDRGRYTDLTGTELVTNPDDGEMHQLGHRFHHFIGTRIARLTSRPDITSVKAAELDGCGETLSPCT